MGATAPQRLECRDPYERFAAEIEDHRIPAGRGDVGTEAAQAFAAEERAGIGRRVVYRVEHLLFGDQALHGPTRDQAVVQALLESHVGVLQVDHVQPRRRPRQPLATAESLEQTQFRRPVQQVCTFHGVAFEQVQHHRPLVDDVGRARIVVALAIDMLGDAIEVDPLQGESGELTSVRQCHGGPQCRVVADVVDRRDGSRELQIGEIHSGLDEVEHQSRRTDLEVRRHLRQIRVADDHVQSAVLVGVRVRFVAGVDDAPLERRLEAHLHLDVVGALRQLEPGFVPDWPIPTRPEPQITCRDAKNGDSPAITAEKGVSRDIR